MKGDSVRMRAAPEHERSKGIIARYGEWLPRVDPNAVVTLGEGGTPLIEACAVSEAVREAQAQAQAAAGSGTAMKIGRAHV